MCAPVVRCAADGGPHEVEGVDDEEECQEEQHDVTEVDPCLIFPEWHISEEFYFNKFMYVCRV